MHGYDGIKMASGGIYTEISLITMDGRKKSDEDRTEMSLSG
jgi:hypothetical protein